MLTQYLLYRARRAGGWITEVCRSACNLSSGR